MGFSTALNFIEPYILLIDQRLLQYQVITSYIWSAQIRYPKIREKSNKMIILFSYYQITCTQPNKILFLLQG